MKWLLWLQQVVATVEPFWYHTLGGDGVKPGKFLQTMKEMLWTAYWNINLPEMFQYSLKSWNSIDESWLGITRQVHTSWCENIHSSRLETIRLLEHTKWPQQLSVFLATSKYIIRSSTYMPKSMYIHLVYEVAFAKSYLINKQDTYVCMYFMISWLVGCVKQTTSNSNEI